MIRYLVLPGILLIGTAAWADESLEAPPPVSGRSLANPGSITSADNLARVHLIRDNLELIREYMGRAEPRPPLLRVENAQRREVYFQAYNLHRRVDQLSSEHLRTPHEPPPRKEPPFAAADVMVRLNESLVRVLRVKQSLGIEATVGEKVKPASTTSTEVFNAIVEAGQLAHVLVDKKTTASDVYGGVAFTLHVASSMHAKHTKRFLPEVPAFEPNKTPADVYRQLHECLELLRVLAERTNVEMLEYALPEQGLADVTPDDVTELLPLMVAELIHLYVVMVGQLPEIPLFKVQRRYPAHTYQRARHLHAILSNIVEATK